MNKVIDISQHNGFIDFNKVKNDGVEAIIIRVGWIGNKQNHTLDTRFKEYYQKAKEVGLKIGFYVYSYCKTIETLRNGVDWLVSKIEDKTFELPIFLDLEDETIKDIGKDTLTIQAVQFCTIIENLGYKAGVYASKDWFLYKLDINKILNFKIWLAEWNGRENHTLGYKVDLWQYTSKGKINGITSNVDINKCLCDCVENTKENKNDEKIINGDDEEVKRYVNGSTSEIVYADTKCTLKIGSINPRGECDCLGIFNNLAMVRYPIYNNGNVVNYKIGFVKWLGGVK